MTETDRRLDANEGYLAASVALTRLRLLRHACLLAGAGVWPADGIGATGGEGGSDDDLAAASTRLADAERVEPPPAAVVLARNLGLTNFERNLLLLCVAMELDTRVAGLCARAQDDPRRRFPTFALAMAVLPDPQWDALSPERPLRYWHLIEITPGGAEPLTTSPLRADERLVSYLKGLNFLDERLTSLLLPLSLYGDEPLPASQEAQVEAVCAGLEAASRTGNLPVVQLAGADASGKQLVALETAARLGLRLCRLPAELLSANATDLDVLARLWHRESLLLPLAIYLDAHDTDKQLDSPGSAVNRFISRASGLVFLDVRESWARLDRDALTFDVVLPAAAEQRDAWRRQLGPGNEDGADRLADQFNLSTARIHRIGRAARLARPSLDNQAEATSRVWAACLRETRPRLELMAQRIEPRATFDDIVLPEVELTLLHQIAGQVRQRARVYDEWGFRRRMNRGLGISALFAGESGTGKTMAAEVLANDLELDLYRIDLSAVVSKYIGETEKNLRRVFDAAEDGGAILLFDEADALFGKRSEVRDSHDRYANIEVNYLLQRMEAYRGLAVLATNMKSALDSAFMRRLRFVLHFPFPGQSERRAIWQRAFPPETPVIELDFDRLARLNLAGGSIHNIALNAAFVAAHRGVPVSTGVTLEAARTEFRKLEKPIDEADFRMLEPAVESSRVMVAAR